MSTDMNLLGKALIRLGILLLLFIASPILLTISFKALEKYTEAPNSYFTYGLLTISAFLLLFTIYYAFKTFQVLKEAIFSKT